MAAAAAVTNSLFFFKPTTANHSCLNKQAAPYKAKLLPPPPRSCRNSRIFAQTPSNVVEETPSFSTSSSSTITQANSFLDSPNGLRATIPGTTFDEPYPLYYHWPESRFRKMKGPNV